MEADLFSHMFNNILINAAEAMQNGGTLGIKITTRNKDVLIDVSNTGKAISRKELETSYKPLNDQQKDNHGVGITLCKKIAESAGGSLVLNYNENYGNILRLTLPIIEII
jgi:sensor histidine kinase regulating citrate/malate metabolism